MSEPLDAADIADYHEQGLAHLLVQFKGQTHSSEALWQCETCNEFKDEPLDFDGQCAYCARQTEIDYYYTSGSYS